MDFFLLCLEARISFRFETSIKLFTFDFGLVLFYFFDLAKMFMSWLGSEDIVNSCIFILSGHFFGILF